MPRKPFAPYLVKILNFLYSGKPDSKDSELLPLAWNMKTGKI
jgi:hypothetical protein